jgi:succinyl-diaminopimelate desuccinylase
LHVQLVGEFPHRPNLIVSTKAEGDTGLLLLGHLDTVPPGDETTWRVPPFSGTVLDGKIYGRGAIDTKSGMAAALYALAALRQVAGDQLPGRVQLICVPDEETGATGTLGIKYLHANGLLSGLGAIYAYSGRQLTLGHRGLIRYRLRSKGESVHTGASEWQDGTAGANAVTGMARLLLELESLQFPNSSHKYFERFRPVITPGTVIQGGVNINIVPDTCEALMDIRIPPDDDRERIETLLDDCIKRVTQERPKLAFEYELLNYAPAAISDENAQVVKVLETVTEQLTGVLPERVVAGPANEGYLLIERGIPTICGFGPTGANAHASDEYVDIHSLAEAAAIFGLTAWRLSKFLA